MGQQQLLLLVLGIIIVGLAVFVGINIFNQQTLTNQADDVLSRNVRIAQEAVNWRGRALMYGGGGNGTFDSLATQGLDVLGVNDVSYTQLAIQSASGLTLEIVGVSTLDRSIGSYVRLNGNVIDSTAVRTDGSIRLP